MYRVLKVNVCKCQYAPPIHIIITSNHNFNCTCVSHVYKNTVHQVYIKLSVCLQKQKKNDHLDLNQR